MLTDTAAAPMEPAAPRVKRRLDTVAWLYLGAIVGVALVIQRLSDVWWPATLVMFAPRWIWGLPLLLLVPLAYRRQRRLLWVLGAAAIVLAVPVMGFVPPSLSTLKGREAKPELRLLTYNIGGGDLDPTTLPVWLDELAPDVAVFQECAIPVGAARPGLLLRGWQVEIQQGSCMVSRYPIRKVEARDPMEIWKMGGSGIIVRYEVVTPGRVVNVVNVHLATVRHALSTALTGSSSGPAALESNIEQRDIESTLARAFANQTPGPLIVAGDFNMPPESAIFRRYWSDMTNAFSASGWGWGVTKATRWHGIRIDHVLLGKGWASVQSWVGPHLGLDHRPMIADLAWYGTP